MAEQKTDAFFKKAVRTEELLPFVKKNLAKIVKTLGKIVKKESRPEELSGYRSELLSHTIESVISDKVIQQNVAMTSIFKELIEQTELDQKFQSNPIGYLQEGNVFISEMIPGEIAPGMEFKPQAFVAMVKDARKTYREGNTDIVNEIKGVHSETSRESYVREDRRTTFTFRKSNIRGTERSAIASSDTRTSTVTSAKNLFNIKLEDMLIDPNILSTDSSVTTPKSTK